MTTLRAQMALPAAAAGIAFGFLLSFIVLDSLHTQLTNSLRTSADRQAIIVQTYLDRVQGLDVLTPTGIAVLGLTPDGLQSTLLPPTAFPEFYSISSVADVPPPEAFLTTPYVGRIVPWTGSNETPELKHVNRLVVLVPTRQAVLTYTEIRARLILSVFVGVLALVGVLVAVAGRLAHRIKRLTESARQLDSPTPIPDSVRFGSDEIGQLGAQLELARTTLAEKHSEVVRLQSIRSEFLANVSHEVRTPLFALKGFLETLLDGGINDPSVSRSFLEKAQNHAGRLDLLLKDLIDISRIESGDMRLSFRYFAVAPFLREVVEDHREAATRRGHTIELTVVDEDAIGDRSRLRQVLDNLLSNAVNYCPNGSRIQVRGEAFGAGVRITVEDNGHGIAPEHLPRLFERFYRVDADRSREQGGTGLGLAIVKHIIEAHGSKICVESILGKRTSFYFDLRK